MFDPYYTWLGIPPEEQPANFYRLLGLRRFESNSDVISNASDRQLAHIRTFQAGPHSYESQRLLNEIANATHVLLSPERKFAYDQQLTPQAISRHPPAQDDFDSYAYTAPPLSVAEPIVPPPTVYSTAGASYYEPYESAGRVSSPPISQLIEPAYVPTTRGRSSRHRPGQSSLATIGKIFVGGIVGLAIGWVIVNRLILPSQKKTDVAKSKGPEERRKQQLRPPTPSPAPLVPPSGQIPPSRQSPLPQVPEKAEAEAVEPPLPTPVPEDREPPASDAPIPKSENPFAGLPGMIALPAPVAGEALSLLNLACSPRESLNLSLDSKLADVGASGKITLIQKGEGNTSWTLSLASESELVASTLLANIILNDKALELEWIAPESVAGKQLANCFLLLQSGIYEHVVQLRDSRKESAVIIDLDESRQTIKFDLSPQPHPSELVLYVEDIVRFPADAELRGAKSRLALGQETAVEFTNMPGAAIEVRFGRQTDGSVAVIISPVFNEKGAGKYELTKKRVAEMNSGAREWLDKAKKTIPQLQSQLSSLDTEHSNLFAADVGRGEAQALRERRLSSLKSQITAVRSRLRNLQRQVPEMQLRVAAAPRMKEFLESVHQTAALKLKIGARSEGRELVLVQLSM